MSNISKVVLGSSIVVSTGIIVYVHYMQEIERKQLHSGVIKDIERQERKRENLRILEEQQKFAEALRNSQDTTLQGNIIQNT